MPDFITSAMVVHQHAPTNTFIFFFLFSSDSDTPNECAQRLRSVSNRSIDVTWMTRKYELRGGGGRAVRSPVSPPSRMRTCDQSAPKTFAITLQTLFHGLSCSHSYIEALCREYMPVIASLNARNHRRLQMVFGFPITFA